MNQIIGGRTMIAVQRRMEDTCGTAGIEAEAAVAAMEQVADRAEELPPGETTKCLRGEANAEVTFLPNDDLSTAPKTNVGAFQGPPPPLGSLGAIQAEGAESGGRGTGGTDESHEAGRRGQGQQSKHGSRTPTAQTPYPSRAPPPCQITHSQERLTRLQWRRCSGLPLQTKCFSEKAR